MEPQLNLSLFLFLFAPAHAGPLSGAVRLGGGAGISEIGGAVRINVEAEEWLRPHLAVGVRAGGGADGLDRGRLLLGGEVLVPVRLGGDALAIVLVPGLGLAWHSDYVTTATLTGSSPTVAGETTEQGFGPEASLGLQLSGRMAFLSMAIGPRIETLGFRSASATLNLSLGVGW